MTKVALTAVLVAAGMLGTGMSAAHRQDSHNSDLALPRVDTFADGKVVVSLDAAGDLQGTLTLTMHPVGDGSYAGTWAFMVTHIDNTDPETGVEPPPHEHAEGEHHEDAPHADFVRLVHRGSLNGSISGAMLTFHSDGRLDAITAPLTIDAGSNEFNGVTGSGTASLASLMLIF